MYYKNVTTFDYFAFNNNILIAESLPLNAYFKFRYDDKYLKDKINLKPNRKTIKLNNIYLFIYNNNNVCGGNFFHFTFHYMQKLVDYFTLNKSEIKIAIPLYSLEFQKEILKSIVSDENILYIDIYKFNYDITNCYIGKYYDTSSIPLSLFTKYQNIGLNYNNQNFENKNMIYIGRKDNEINNGGNNRYIINNNEFTDFLNKNNILNFYFEDYNLKNKINNLIDLKPKVIITEIGSGLTNFLFFPKDFFKEIKFIIIDQINWKLDKSRIYGIIKLLDIKYQILRCKNTINNKQQNLANNPFTIDVKKLNYIIANI